MPRLPKNLKISFEKSPPPRPEPEPSPEVETVFLEEPDIDALDDMVPQFVEKDPPVESDIFAPAQPRKPKKPPEILKVAEEPPPLPKKAPKLTKTGKVRKEMSEVQKAKARENLKKARELRASRLKAQAPPEPVHVEAPEPVHVEPPAPAPAPSPPPVQAPSPAPLPEPVQSRGISQADLKQSNLDAIMEYEAIRKKRKAVKKEKQMVEQQRQDVIGVAQKASMSGWAQTSGRFAGCY